MQRTTPDLAAAIVARQLRVVLSALAAGLILFAVVASIVELDVGDRDHLDILIYIVPFLAIGNITAYLVIRSKLLAAARGRVARGRVVEGEWAADLVPNELRTLTVIAAALAESVGLLGIVVFMLTRTWALLAAPAAAILAIVALLPSEQGLKDLIRQLRQG